MCVPELVCSDDLKRKNKRKRMMLVLKESFITHTLVVS